MAAGSGQHPLPMEA